MAGVAGALLSPWKWPSAVLETLMLVAAYVYKGAELFITYVIILPFTKFFELATWIYGQYPNIGLSLKKLTHRFTSCLSPLYKKCFGSLGAPFKDIYRNSALKRRIDRGYEGIIAKVPWLQNFSLYAFGVSVMGYLAFFAGILFQCLFTFGRYFLLWIILVVLWFFIGYPLLMFESAPQEFNAFVNVVVTGGIAFVDILLSFWNVFALVLNAIQPYYNLALRLGFGILTAIVGSLNNVVDDLTTAAGSAVGVNDNRYRSLATSPAYNPFLNEDVPQDFERGVQGLILAQSVPVYVLIKVADYVIVMIEYIKVVASIFGAIADILSLVVGGGCCGSSIDAVGCCIREIFANLVIAFVRLLSFGDALIVQPSVVRDAIACKSVSGVSCKCSAKEGGVFNTVPACRAPDFECRKLIDGSRITYEEWITTYTGANGGAQQTLNRVGTTEAAACRNALRKNRGRVLFIAEGEETCGTYCHRYGEESYLFVQCHKSQTRYYNGSCDRPLNNEQRLAHLKTYMDKEDLPKTERRRLVSLEMDGTVRKGFVYPQTPPPTTGGITFQRFLKYIEELEKRPSSVVDCNTDGIKADEFGRFAFRMFCLTTKAIQDNSVFILSRIDKAREESKGSLPLGARHLAVIVNYATNPNATFEDFHRDLIDTHKQVYREYTGENSTLEDHEGFFGKALPSIRRDLRATLLNSKAKYQASSFQGRKLQDEPVIYGFEYYECPDGIKVLPTNKLECGVPTKWNPVVLVRYFFYLITVFFESFDTAPYLIYSAFSCWEEYSRNPNIDPTTTQAWLKRLKGEVNDDLVYCFPLFESIPFAPLIVWDWNKFVKAQCQEALIKPGQAIVQSCVCPQYDSQGIFNYKEYWLAWTPIFYRARLFNTVRVFQFLVTRIPGLNTFLDGFWYSIFSLMTTDQDVLFAFNEEYQNYGQSLGQNIFCVVLNTGSFTWTMVFVVFPFYGLMMTFFDPFRRLLNVLNMNDLRKYMELRKKQKKKLPSYQPEVNDKNV